VTTTWGSTARASKLLKTGFLEPHLANNLLSSKNSNRPLSGFPRAAEAFGLYWEYRKPKGKDDNGHKKILLLIEVMSEAVSLLKNRPRKRPVCRVGGARILYFVVLSRGCCAAQVHRYSVCAVAGNSDLSFEALKNGTSMGTRSR
jgi:hypothetical protein